MLIENFTFKFTPPFLLFFKTNQIFKNLSKFCVWIQVHKFSQTIIYIMFIEKNQLK